MDFGALDLASLWPFIAVGFAAQLVDGALGMAFGVISNSLMVGVLGVPPALASQRVHVVECFTTATSGISHLLHGNIDKKLFFRLLLPGVVGGVAGAYLLSSIDAGAIKPVVLLYLSGVGVYLLWRGLAYPPKTREAKHVAPLGLLGGFLDAAGGGGWGPVVASTLMARGNHARLTVGSVNAAEFFVTLAASITFIITLGISHWPVIAGLAIGGGLAAPIAAYACKRIPLRPFMFMVGLLVIGLSLRTLIRALA